MITEQTLTNFLTKKGHIPACPSICIKYIKYNRELEDLYFYVNPHNLCWLTNERFREYHKDNMDVITNIFVTNSRDIKLSEIL